MAKNGKRIAVGDVAKSGSSPLNKIGSIADPQQTRELNDTIQNISNDDFDSDAARYAYAVSVASDKMGDELDTDSNEFYTMVKDVYEQQDPEESFEEFRNEDPLSSGIRGARMAIDNVNDFIGDGIKGAWDILAGNVIGQTAGAIAESMFGVDNATEDWMNAAQDLVSDDAADALAGIGTDLAVAAIPGLGLPLSVAKGLVESSDDIYEAITGRDDITLQQLTDDQRIGRGLSGVLSAAMSMAPAVGKARNMMKAGTKLNDVADIAERTTPAQLAFSDQGIMDDAVKGAYKKVANDPDAYDAAYNHAYETLDNDEAIKVLSDLKEGNPVTDERFWQDSIENQLEPELDRAAGGMMENLAAVGRGDAVPMRNSALEQMIDRNVPANPDIPSRIGRNVRGYMRGTGESLKSTGRGVRGAIDNLLHGSGNKPMSKTNNPLSRLASGYSTGRSGAYSQYADDAMRGVDAEDFAEFASGGKRAKGYSKAAEMLRGGNEEIGGPRGFMAGLLDSRAANRMKKNTGRVVEEGVIPVKSGGRIARTTGNTVANMVGGMPLAYLNMVGATGSWDPRLLVDMLGSDLGGYILASAAPGMGGLSRRFGLVDTSGASPRPYGRTQASSLATRANVGDMFRSYGQEPAVTYEDLIRRLNENFVGEDEGDDE